MSLTGRSKCQSGLSSVPPPDGLTGGQVTRYSLAARTPQSCMTKFDRRLPREVFCLTSPKAGTGRGIDLVRELASRLRHLGVDVSVDNDLTELRRWSQRRQAMGEPGLVVAAGGDGTLTLVAGELDARTPVVPLPLGTENLVARHFGFSRNADEVLATICHGDDVVIDAGSANGRLFLVMTTCGFDAEVVRAMHLTRRGHISRWSYCGPILRALRRYSFPELVVETTDDLGAIRTVRCGWAMVFNLPCYAASLRIEPAASALDGHLNLIAFTRRGRVSGFRYLADIRWGSHIGRSDVVRVPIRACRITSEVPVAYQRDGDYAGKLPLEIAIVPARVLLRVPSAESRGDVPLGWRDVPASGPTVMTSPPSDVAKS